MNLKYRKSSLIGLNDRDIMTRIRIINSFQLSDEAFLKKYYCDRETLFNICLPSFKKSKREKSDIKLVSLYLANLKKFLSLIKNYNEDNKNNSTQKEKNEQKNKYIKLLKYISENIIYESFSNKRLIMRYGDSGNKFYLILYGTVSILIPVKISLSMTFYEYCQYIATLLLYKEFELAKNVIRENKHIYSLDIPDIKYIINFFNKEEEENKSIFTNSYIKGIKSAKSITNKIIKSPRKKTNKISLYLSEKKEFQDDDKILKEEQDQKINKFMKICLTPEQYKLFEEIKNNKQDIEKDDGIEITSEIYINRLKSYKYNQNYNNIIRKEKRNKKANTSRRKTRARTSLHNEIENQKDDNSYFLNTNKNLVYIYEYQEIIQLESGDMFGDMALSNTTSKRTASIISASDCHFGSLNKDIYYYIKFSNDKNRKNIINYISRTRIFKSLKYKAIEERFINYFAFKNCVKDEHLIKIGEVNNNLIIIKNGKFEINVKGEIKSIFDLINQYKKNNSIDLSLSENILRKINKININRIKIEKLFKNIPNDIIHKLFVINSSAIFGFKETEKQIKDDYKSFFEIKCSSSEGEYVLIDKKIFYRQIYTSDFKVKEETNSYIKEFIDRTIDRLIYIIYSNIYHMLSKNNLKLFRGVKILSNEEKKGNETRQKNLMSEFKLDYDYMNKYKLTDIEYIIDIILNKYTEEDFDNENININSYENNCDKNIKRKNTIILEEEKYNITNSKSIFKYLRNKKRINSLKLSSFRKSTKNQINNNNIINIKEKEKEISNDKNDKLIKYRRIKIKSGKNTSFSEDKKINFINDNQNKNTKKINNYINNISCKNGRNKNNSLYALGRTSDSFVSDVNINCNYTNLYNACISKINFNFKKNNSNKNYFETSKTNNRPNSRMDQFIDLKMKQIFGSREIYTSEINKFNRCFSAKHNSAINIFDTNPLSKDSYSEKRQKYLLKYARDIWTRNRPIILYKRRKKIGKII